MQYYELLFIIPGTLSEDEAKPLAEKVKEMVTVAGGKEAMLQDLGKSRLAYPMKHIRYGYFEICRFQAEPAIIPDLETKLRLMGRLLRSGINKIKEGQAMITKISAISDVTIRESVKEEEGVAEEPVVSAAEKAETAAHTIRTTAPEAEKSEKRPTETKAEDVKLDEIDKKLDELLEADIADV